MTLILTYLTQERGVNTNDCVEKADFIKKILGSNDENMTEGAGAAAAKEEAAAAAAQKKKAPEPETEEGVPLLHFATLHCTSLQCTTRTTHRTLHHRANQSG